MRHILLTRPQEESERLADRLAETGISGLIEPLLVLRPSLTLPPPNANPQAVILTSANALRFLGTLSHEITKLLPLPCFCIGSATAEAAKQFGFTNRRDAGGDGRALASHIEDMLSPANGALLHIAGEDIDSTAQNELQKTGFTVTPWATYRTDVVTAFSPMLLRMMTENRIETVLFFSPRTAETFNTLMQKHGLEKHAENMIALGISEKTVAPLANLRWRKLVSAASPTEDAVLQRLQGLVSENDHE